MQRKKSRTTGAGLEAWIKRHNLTRAAAAQALGISLPAVYAILAGTRPASKTVALLMKALDELAARDGK